MTEQAERFAARLRREAGDDVGGQVRLGFRLAFSREPTDVEIAAATKLATDHGLAAVCRALFNANEFLYVD
jgi:hypothetical protein